MTPQELLASFDGRTVTVYQAYGWSIAGPAIKAGRFVAPFSTTRLTWIKPSFLWMMHRSGWGSAPGQEHILAIELRRSDWDQLLSKAILTTPVSHVYPDKKKWRRELEKSPVRVQWDPDYDLQDKRLQRRAIQVGIVPPLVAEYAKWPVRIRDITERVHQMRALVANRRLEKARRLLPELKPYPLTAEQRRALGMTS